MLQKAGGIISYVSRMGEVIEWTKHDDLPPNALAGPRRALN